MTARVMPTSRRTLLAGIGGVGALGALLAPGSAEAALGDPAIPASGGDFFLRLDGIPGSSVRDGHEGEIEPLTFWWGAGQQEGSKDGKVAVAIERLLLVSGLGIQSPELYQHLLAGRRIATGRLTARRTVEGETSDYFELHFVDTQVVDYRVTPNAEHGFVMELVELHLPAPPRLVFDGLDG